MTDEEKVALVRDTEELKNRLTGLQDIGVNLASQHLLKAVAETCEKAMRDDLDLRLMRMTSGID